MCGKPAVATRCVWCLGVLACVEAAHADPAWWNGDYAYRRTVTVTNNSSSPLVSGYTIDVTFDHAGMVTGGKSLASGNDVRLVYWDGGGNNEIDRVLKSGSGWNGGATQIAFKTQAGIAGSGHSGDAYWMYYGYNAAASPPANANNVYLFHDDFETGPLDGNKWYVEDGNWSVSGGVLQQTQLNSDFQVITMKYPNADDVAVEGRFRPTGSDGYSLPLVGASARKVPNFDTQGYGFWFWARTGPTKQIEMSGTGGTGGDFIPVNQWTDVSLRVWGSNGKVMTNGVVRLSTGSAMDQSGYATLMTDHASCQFDNMIIRSYTEPEPATAMAAETCQTPSIGGQPDDEISCVGASVTISVAASGVAPLSYQWRKDGNDLSGATGDELTFDPAQAVDAGVYDVVVTNPCGSVLSGSASLVVNPGPDCDIVVAGPVCPDTSDNTCSVADAGMGATYTWTLTGGTIDAGQGTSTITFSVGGGPALDIEVAVVSGSGCSSACQTSMDLIETTWVGMDGGAFSEPGNWNPAGTPQANTVIRNSGAADNRAVLSTGVESGVCSLLLEATGSGRQILQINAGARLLAAEGTVIGAGAEVDLRGGELTGGTVTNQSNTVTGYGTVSADLMNEGLVRGSARDRLILVGGTFGNGSAARFLAPLAGVIVLDASSITQAGEIELHTIGGLSMLAPLSNEGALTLLGGSIGTSDAGGITNETIGDIAGFGTIDCSVTNEGETTVIADMQIVGDLTNHGTISIQSGILTVTGDLSNSGTIIGGFGGRGGAESGVAIHGDFDLQVRDWRRLDLTSATLNVLGGHEVDPALLEAAAEDRGALGVRLPDARLYSIGTLRIGGGAWARLVDRRVNTPSGSARSHGPEAVYVQRLVIESGGVLDLAGRSIYYQTCEPASAGVIAANGPVVDSVGGGRTIRLATTARRDAQ